MRQACSNYGHTALQLEFFRPVKLRADILSSSRGASIRIIFQECGGEADF